MCPELKLLIIVYLWILPFKLLPRQPFSLQPPLHPQLRFVVTHPIVSLNESAYKHS